MCVADLALQMRDFGATLCSCQSNPHLMNLQLKMAITLLSQVVSITLSCQAMWLNIACTFLMAGGVGARGHHVVGPGVMVTDPPGLIADSVDGVV